MTPDYSGFISKKLVINKWDDLRPYFADMLSRRINSTAALKELILHLSEVFSVYAEAKARAYVAMTCDTGNSDHVKRHDLLASEIAAHVEIMVDGVTRKIVSSPYFDKLPGNRFRQLKKILRHQLSLFCEENVALNSKVNLLVSRYEQMAGALTVVVRGEEITMPEARQKLESKDRSLRRDVYEAVAAKRLGVKKDFDDLYDEMVAVRHQIALNAGYRNFRDYQHDYLKRFDYKPGDTLAFHRAVEKSVVPLAGKIQQEHARKLGLENDYRPWDVFATPENEEPLKPFEDVDSLLNKAERVFSRLHPDFSEQLKKLRANSLLDLASRKNKAPGGYNYALEVTGMPFIFMNAAGMHDDMVTLMHECGHAFQTFLTNQEKLVVYRDLPSETAETASMGMELISSVAWDEFYAPADLDRARKDHREGIVSFFPWCMTVDAFQHGIYLHPEFSPSDRDTFFDATFCRFDPGVIDWSGFEAVRRNDWQKQLHIFTLPFYYIEYGIAQLGALQVYRNFINDRKRGIDLYRRGLALGASRPIPEVWRQMGISFDFGEKMLRELVEFIGGL